MARLWPTNRNPASENQAHLNGARYHTDTTNGLPSTWSEAVLPTGLLRETHYYGHAGTEQLECDGANWQHCYDLITGSPVAAEGISGQIEADLLTTTGCVDGSPGKPADPENQSNGVGR